MNLEILLRGLFVGFLASITLGPVCVMCIQRTLSKNRLSGFVSGLGAATADTIFAISAYFFVAVISGFIESNIQIIKIIGGVCIIGVGIHFFLKNPVVQIRRNRAGKSNLGQDYASTFVLTLTNVAARDVLCARRQRGRDGGGGAFGDRDRMSDGARVLLRGDSVVVDTDGFRGAVPP